MKPTEQLMLSIGALLASEREKRGIPVERAAKETRMRPQRIRDMEGDDLSQFSNPSYARMFIIAYAKYLDIPMPTIREYLPDRGESGADGYQYIATPPDELPSLRRDLVSRPLHRSIWLPILGFAALLLIAGAAILGAFIYVNVNRITAAVDKPPAPEPTPQIIVVEPKPTPVVLENLSAAAKPASFEAPAQINEPPAPLPVVAEPARVEIKNPDPVQTILASPTPAASPTEDADRAFLLGSSPEQKPAPVP